MAGSLFYLPVGQEDAHAARLAAGLRKLPEGFLAEVCPLCRGQGRHAHFMCRLCRATGLVQGEQPAPLSVLNQVLTAATAVGTAAGGGLRFA
jgi:hypothetical protein